MQAPSFPAGPGGLGVPARAHHLAKIAAGFRISEATAHAYVHSVTSLLTDKAPSLTRALRRAKPEYVLLDGTIAECDRVGDGERDYSGKARRHRVNIQAVTGPAGELIWYSPALAGRTSRHHRCTDPPHHHGV